MLHDISRKNQEIAKVQNLHDLEARAFEFNLQDIEAYENHPPDVDVLVVQHHERPDGSGFPSKLFAHQISPLSALFIVAHDLVSFLYDEGSHESLKDFVLRYKEQYKIGNFKKILANLPIN